MPTLHRFGGGQETNTTLKGKLYRRFLAAAATFTGHDEKTILASNVHGEQCATHAYEEALNEHTLVAAPPASSWSASTRNRAKRTSS